MFYYEGEVNYMEMFLTVEQAAERLQMAPYTLRTHLKAGKLRGVKRGRVWRIPESALHESTVIADTKSGDGAK